MVLFVFVSESGESEKDTTRIANNNYRFFNRSIYFLSQVRDGSEETAPLFGKYCGSTLPAPILSSTNVLWIRFKSDSSVSHAGFRAVYEISKFCYYTTNTTV